MKKIKTSEIIVIIIIISILILMLLPALVPPKNATRALSILQGNGTAAEANKDFNNVCKWLEQKNFKVVNRETQSVGYKGKYKKAELRRISVLVNLNKPYIEILLEREMEYKNHPDFLELYSKLGKMIKRDNKVP